MGTMGSFANNINSDLAMIGHNHWLGSSNPYLLDSRFIQYYARTLGYNNFEFNLYHVNDDTGDCTALGYINTNSESDGYGLPTGVNQVIENNDQKDNPDTSVWIYNLTLDYANANDGTSSTNTATLVNKFDYAIPNARVRFVVPQGIVYAVSQGTIEQQFDGDSVCVVDVRVDISPDSTTVIDVFPGLPEGASASGENAPNETADEAFDGDDQTKWVDDSPAGSWIQWRYASGIATIVDEYAITSADNALRDPRDFNLLGSNNHGGSWDSLDSKTGVTFEGRLETQYFSVNSPAAYNVYRLEITAVADAGNADAVQLAELELLEVPDIVPPSPDPMTWEIFPYATGSTSISMTATTATDISGVEYYFACDADGGNDSGWQTSTSYTDAGLTPETTYTYTVIARDLSINNHETAVSSAEQAITDPLVGIDNNWNDNGGDGLWKNPSNWSGGFAPRSVDKAAIRADIAGPIIDSSTAAVANVVVCGDWGHTGSVDITGGSLTTNDWFTLGYGVSDEGTFNVSGGTVSVGGAMKVARAGTGTMNMTGGSITALGSFVIAELAGSTGNVYFDGGTISCSSFIMTSDGWLDITAGTLIVSGDATSTINDYIGSGWITAYDGAGTLSVDYNTSNPGKTTVTASSGSETDPPTPNPATFASAPSADSSSAISMTATTGSDPSGPVEYRFVETSGNPGGTDSGWQTSVSYTDNGLDADTQYTYTVTMRDALGNTGTAATPANATTDAVAADVVTITKAEYKADKDEFKVEATSSDQPTFTLTLVGFGDMTWKNNKYEYKAKPLGQKPPCTVTVTSFGGGSDSKDVSGADSCVGGETDPPRPNPAAFAFAPAADSETAISMTATAGTDATGPVEYNFVETSGNPGGTASGWQTSASYTDTGLNASTQYSYTVQMCDSETPTPNVGTASSPANATTDSPDLTAPDPDPMTFATAPYATGETSIAMVATTATDASGVEYYFTCTAGGCNDSGWQSSISYTDTGLTASTQYTYTVTARDLSPAQIATAASAGASATTNSPDLSAPTPDQMTWAAVPYSTGNTSIAMVATTATDPSGVEYNFTCTAGGGNDSGWQDSTSYEDTDLQPSTQYTYTVKARDKSAAQNAAAASSAASATTDDVPADTVTITKAEYKSDKGELKVESLSSDGGNVTLTVVGFGNMTWKSDKNKYELKKTISGTPPCSVTVTSSGGGSDSRDTGANPCLDDDTDAPTPDPMTWVQVPVAISHTEIAMTASSATDASGVEYYFTCTAGGGNDSGWQDSTSYTPIGLTPETQYTYTVTARDKSGNQNATGASIAKSATTDAEPIDDNAPTPDPMTFATAPHATGSDSIAMTATTATDDLNGVEYYFSTAGGGHDSGWQSGTSYEDTGLSPETQYTYTVMARDTSSNQNATAAFTPPLSATTDPAPSGDTVTITKAEYKSDKSEFKAEATSSDGGNVTLTVVGYGTMTWKADKNMYEYKAKPADYPGATVTVTSSGGGQDTANVSQR
jgi:hypothetical protein